MNRLALAVVVTVWSWSWALVSCDGRGNYRLVGDGVCWTLDGPGDGCRDPGAEEADDGHGVTDDADVTDDAGCPPNPIGCPFGFYYDPVQGQCVEDCNHPCATWCPRCLPNGCCDGQPCRTNDECEDLNWCTRDVCEWACMPPCGCMRVCEIAGYVECPAGESCNPSTGACEPDETP